MTCRIERPDTRQHLTEFAESTKETACVYGGVHTRADWTPIGVVTRRFSSILGGQTATPNNNLDQLTLARIDVEPLETMTYDVVDW